MIDDITMPGIAIGGGFLLLFVLACILIVRARLIARRRRLLLDARRTSFHLAVIVPSAAEHGRAAFEDVPSPLQISTHEVRDEQLIEVVDIPLPPPPPIQMNEYTTIGYAPRPPEPRPNMNVRMHYVGPRMARGSTPAIVTAPPAHGVYLAPRPADWDVPVTASVTARMRAYRRG
jgi:hypothetical protein